MTLAKVIGNAVCTIKNGSYENRKSMLVAPVAPDGSRAGKAYLAVDSVGCGAGETVVVIDEGGSARILLESDEVITIRTVIAAVVDKIGIGE
jgi:microcompartment protein CcmK/EutM